jgi:alpha-tubulin suppressor-like RCC1 family protein
LEHNATPSSESTPSSDSSSTDKEAHSSTSSESSESTVRFPSSSSSSIDAILKATGLNEYGELGFGNRQNTNVFLEVPFDESRYYNIVAGGAYHSFIQISDGTVWATGRNDHGQLGLGDYVDRTVFNRLPESFDDAKKIVCGEYFSVIEKIRRHQTFQREGEIYPRLL